MKKECASFRLLAEHLIIQLPYENNVGGSCCGHGPYLLTFGPGRGVPRDDGTLRRFLGRTGPPPPPLGPGWWCQDAPKHVQSMPTYLQFYLGWGPSAQPRLHKLP